ncbi:PilO [Desulfamplus magnetovallimortis]|uniref:PilO n=1 Tax=Desulfamplus magnetovallimortis TaxID=1246637 RepID=A0A1W1HI95_9BACT|nr:type 4a pilus biogenesis protein PilO [Desulfamplus magnetovallimortis]SLM32194.1 PilO [Desulfamplus magnetovallimortis]
MSKEKKQVKSIVSQFKEKTAPFFEKVGKLSRKQRLLICVATLAVMGGGFYYFFLAPRLEKIVSLENEYASLNSQLSTYKIKAAKLEKVETELKEKEDDFHTALLALPDKKEINSLLTAVSKSGNDAGLEFVLFKPEAVVKKDFYAEVPVSIKVEGGYHQLAEFFDRVSQLSRLVNIRDIVMSYAKAGDEALEVSCTAVTYTFIEQKDAEAEQPKPTKDKRRRGK